MDFELIPPSISRTHLLEELSSSMEGVEVNVYGWAEQIRLLGKLIFIVLRDRTGKTQITLHAKSNTELFDQLKQITPETAMVVQGIIKPNIKAPNGFELTPNHVWTVGPAKPGVPLDVTDRISANLSTRLDNRVFDLRKARIQSIFKIQNTITFAVHQFFREEGFHEIHTPKIVAEKTEGGANVFPVTYFKRDAYLAQSPQLYKQLMLLAGFDRVYEIAPVYRAEPHATIRHLNEYTSIDAEISFIHDHHDVMDSHEALIKYVLRAIAKEHANILEERKITLTIPDKFPRIPYRTAISWLQERKVPIEFGDDFATQHEQLIAEIVQNEQESSLFFLIDYPKTIRPFYTMPHPKDDELTSSFDLEYLEYLGLEITTGGQRIHNYEVLLQGLASKGLTPKGFEFYLDPFQYGTPPHGGFGLGLERFTMQILQLDNIREACMFPRDINRLTP